MAQFLAQTSKGLVDVLESELNALGIDKTRKVASGVFFESNWAGCYRANLCLRTATRVLLPVLDFPAYQPDDIYHNVLKHDFTKYIKPEQTLAVNAVVEESKLRDQRIVALKVKDAIVDQFRDKFGKRPDVAKKNPDMLIVVRVFKNTVSLSVDTSGDPLFKRGYRKELVDAPLKEHVAAGMLMLADWNKKTPLVDLSCGSGTILIEAALMAMNVAPGSMRKRFAFQNFSHYSPETWNQVLEEVLAEEKEECDVALFGSDISGAAIKAARINANAAGVGEFIEFKRETLAVAEPPVESGWIVMNPPYGVRLGHVEELKDVYRDLGFTLKQRFKGWDAWVLSGEADLIRELKMKSSKKYFLMNGPIECRWMHYPVNS